MSDLNPYEESLAYDLGRAQARIKELEQAERQTYRDALELAKQIDALTELLATTSEQLVATNEALVKERDQWIEHTKNAVWADSEELKLANARAERLEAALRWYSDDPSSQGDVARAALKGEDHE